ncbi:MAG: hypothetical protein KAT70_03275 [Thermoplasmata archaeon]|nr:hypothetical protein [Thermoplasmata archaeon]
MKKAAPDGLYYRTFKIDSRAVNDSKRSIDVSFSSEVPLKRSPWSPPEILLHGEENADLTPLAEMGSALMNHQPSGPSQPVVIIGRVDDVRLEKQMGRATITFDTDDASELAFSKVKSGSLRGISVGARVQQIIEVEAGNTFEADGRTFDGPVDLALKWSAHEISLTPIPADVNVGVNRSLSDFNTDNNHNSTEESTMDKDEMRTMITEVLNGAGFVKVADLPKTEDTARSVADILKEEARPKMAFSNETQQDLLNRAGAVSVDLKAKVADMCAEGKSENEILRAISDDGMQDSDANDNGGGDAGDAGDNAGEGSGDQTTVVRSFKDVKDDAFIQGFTNPSYTIQ